MTDLDREGGFLVVSPAEAGVHASDKEWIPPFEGMTDIFVTPAQAGIHTSNQNWISFSGRQRLAHGQKALGGVRVLVKGHELTTSASRYQLTSYEAASRFSKEHVQV